MWQFQSKERLCKESRKSGLKIQKKQCKFPEKLSWVKTLNFNPLQKWHNKAKKEKCSLPYISFQLHIKGIQNNFDQTYRKLCWHLISKAILLLLKFSSRFHFQENICTEISNYRGLLNARKKNNNRKLTQEWLEDCIKNLSDKSSDIWSAWMWNLILHRYKCTFLINKKTLWNKSITFGFNWHKFTSFKIDCCAVLVASKRATNSTMFGQICILSDKNKQLSSTNSRDS